MNYNGYFGSINGSVSILLGAGRSNIALAAYLSRRGGKVMICDKRLSENEIVKIIEENKIDNCETVKYGTLPKVDYVFRTPVIRPDDRLIEKLVRKGAYLTSETELFFEKCKGKIYGITGSDGKTTTSTICAELFKKEYSNREKRVFLGGNIGIPLISFVDEIQENDVVVAELSSFQLMTANCSPYRSTITNLTENHLDWHKDKDEYISAKSNICRFSECTRLVTERSAFCELNRIKCYMPDDIILTDEKNGIYSDNKSIYLRGERLLDREEIFVKGEHNVKNFMTAIALTYPSVSFENILKTAQGFKGVPHRIEYVCRKNEVDFYNSSIDSTPSRTLNTLKCFDKNVTLLCGGYDKNLDFTDLAEYINNNVKNVIIYGAASEKIYSFLKNTGASKANIRKIYEFDKAFEKAVEVSEKGDTILLSPACASFDQFKNFEERGERFSALVRSI